MTSISIMFLTMFLLVLNIPHPTHDINKYNIPDNVSSVSEYPMPCMWHQSVWWVQDIYHMCLRCGTLISVIICIQHSSLSTLSSPITMPGASVGGVSDKPNFYNKLYCFWEIAMLGSHSNKFLKVIQWRINSLSSCFWALDRTRWMNSTMYWSDTDLLLCLLCYLTYCKTMYAVLPKIVAVR